MGHGTIFVYSILSVLELSEVLWGMVLYLYTVSCLLLELSEVLWGMVLYLYTVSCLLLYLYTTV